MQAPSPHDSWLRGICHCWRDLYLRSLSCGSLCAAWEVKPADQMAYWQQVPDAVKLTLHYYNVPCSVEPDSEFNPLRIVKTLYQPGDFIVIKVRSGSSVCVVRCSTSLMVCTIPDLQPPDCAALLGITVRGGLSLA